MKYTIEEIKAIADNSYAQTTRPDDNIDQYLRDADNVNCAAYANVLEMMDRYKRIYTATFPHGELINQVHMWESMFLSLQNEIEFTFLQYAKRCNRHEGGK